jgi:hypothetical protein
VPGLHQRVKALLANEGTMTDPKRPLSVPRRSFVGRLAAGVGALGIGGAWPARAQSSPPQGWQPARHEEDMATRLCASGIAKQTGGAADDVFKELVAGMIPNSHVVAAGIVAVSRAQERGYTFSYVG